MSLCVLKDRSFTRSFGVGAPRPLPLLCYGLFATRDALTIASGFNAPALLAPYFPGGLTAAQLFAPAFAQAIVTPVHLLGLDLYNRPLAKDKTRMVIKNWPRTAMARVGRMFASFGLGGVLNIYTRTFCLEKLTENDEELQLVLKTS